MEVVIMKLKVSVEEATKVIDEIVTEEFIVTALTAANIKPDLTEIIAETQGSQNADDKLDAGTTVRY